MITEHPTFQTPSNIDIPIWRYMDLSKFVALIQAQSLYFPIITNLGDPFEGSLPNSELMVKYIINNRHPGGELEHYRSSTPDEIISITSGMRGLFKKILSALFVSCWHMNEYESAAMWSLYSSTSDSICIKTTYRQLAAILPEWAFLGEVKYIDYGSSAFHSGNALNASVRKRMSYAHERELRAVICHRPADPGFHACVDQHVQFDEEGVAMGINVPMNINGLIDNIYVNPKSPSWFLNVVNNILERYETGLSATNSALSAKPLF